MKGTLYIVATPIGNTEDITGRAKRILGEVSIVAAEDTRIAQTFFRMLGIQNKTISNHKFNEKRQVDFLLSELDNGKNIAIVSDAGTPCISDPGGVIVRAAAERGINVIGVCGASAVITALSVCGFCFGSFAFYGFLPKESKEIKKAIDIAKKSNVSATVFFESPKRIKKTLEVLAAETPDADLCLCNDLSKMYERIYRGTPIEILNELEANPSAEKGEYTLVANLGIMLENAPNSSQSYESMLVDHIVKHGGSTKDAVNSLAERYKGSVTKKEFYNASLNLRTIFSAQELGNDC